MFNTQFRKLDQILLHSEFSSPQGMLSQEQIFTKSYEAFVETKEKKGVIYLIGNGGSAGIASHFSIDFLNVLQISSFTFFDSNQITCLANDYGYEKVFAIPIERSITEKDTLIAISSSGASPNILQGTVAAKNKGAKILTFSGFSLLNPLRKLGDLNYWVASSEYGMVETLHFFLLHTLIDLWPAYDNSREELTCSRKN